MTMRLPNRDHLKAAALIGLLEVFLFFVGDAVSKDYGFWGGAFVIFALNALIFLVAAINYEGAK